MSLIRSVGIDPNYIVDSSLKNEINKCIIDIPEDGAALTTSIS